MSHWLLEINTKAKEANTTVKNNVDHLTTGEIEVYTSIFQGTETPDGNLFLWALAHRNKLEENADKMGLTVKFPSAGEQRIVWSAPKGHKFHHGSGRVARLKNTGSIALCYGSKVSGASGLGQTKEKERRVKDLLPLWFDPEPTLEPETPKAKAKKKGKSIKE